jgi:hypothetical protein
MARREPLSTMLCRFRIRAAPHLGKINVGLDRGDCAGVAAFDASGGCSHGPVPSIMNASHSPRDLRKINR